MSAKTGMQAKLYYKVGGVAAQGDWVELTNIKDNTLNLEKGEADVTTRANGGWKATIGTLKSGSVEFEMVWDPDDAGFDAVSDAYFNDQVIGLAILDDEIESGTGLMADFAITNFSRKEPLEEAITVSVTAKPTYSETAPVWIEKGATPTASA
jgi:TP901-1 family phage major tail protein